MTQKITNSSSEHLLSLQLVVILTKNTALSGAGLAEILRGEYNIELERAGAGHAIAMTSLCDSAEGFSRLAEALLAIDHRL